jgi:hypothetical protein
MLRFLRETWLPTAVFAALSMLFGTSDHGVIVALIVVPLVWKSFVIRQGRPRVGRAALAGSASAFMILWSEAMMDSVGRFIHSGRNASEELGGLFAIFLPLLTLVGFVVGAGAASLAAFVQARLWPGPPEEPGRADLVMDGAVGGVLVATLIAPFAAIPLAALMPNQRAPTADLLTATAGTWLILASASAWLGVRAVRRWRRILDQGGGMRGRVEGDPNLRSW